MNEAKIYAERDLMILDAQGDHYCRHIVHMTCEDLHSKSDIAAELGWRDLQIQELTQQNSALQLSQDNIINAFGIKSEGAHSKQVIEYVLGWWLSIRGWTNLSMSACKQHGKEVRWMVEKFKISDSSMACCVKRFIQLNSTKAL